MTLFERYNCIFDFLEIIFVMLIQENLMLTYVVLMRGYVVLLDMLLLWEW